MNNKQKCNIKCAKRNLNKAFKLHDEHLLHPDTVTDESQEKLQELIEEAKDCLKTCK